MKTCQASQTEAKLRCYFASMWLSPVDINGLPSTFYTAVLVDLFYRLEISIPIIFPHCIVPPFIKQCSAHAGVLAQHGSAPVQLQQKKAWDPNHGCQTIRLLDFLWF